MTTRLFLLLLGPLLLGLAGPVASATRAELPAGAVVIEAGALAQVAGDGDALAQAWIALVERGEFSAVRRDATADASRAANAAAHQIALSRLVRHLQDGPVGRSGAGRSLLASLAGRVPLAWIRHEETRGDWFLPVVDPGAEAASALRLIGYEDARMAWLARFEADPQGTLRSGFADASHAMRAAEALTLASDASVAQAVQFHRARPGALPAGLVLALAQRMPAPDLFRDAFALADPARRVALVADVPGRLPPADAVVLLKEMAGTTDTGSAAVLALGRLAGDAQVRDLLLDWLGDPRLGASAASALARARGQGTVDALVRHARKSADPGAVRDVALSLRLIDSPAAREALAELAKDARLPAAARSELQP